MPFCQFSTNSLLHNRKFIPLYQKFFSFFRLRSKFGEFYNHRRSIFRFLENIVKFRRSALLTPAAKVRLRAKNRVLFSFFVLFMLIFTKNGGFFLFLSKIAKKIGKTFKTNKKTHSPATKKVMVLAFFEKKFIF